MWRSWAGSGPRRPLCRNWAGSLPSRASLAAGTAGDRPPRKPAPQPHLQAPATETVGFQKAPRRHATRGGGGEREEGAPVRRRHTAMPEFQQRFDASIDQKDAKEREQPRKVVHQHHASEDEQGAQDDGPGYSPRQDLPGRTGAVNRRRTASRTRRDGFLRRARLPCAAGASGF